MSFSFGSVITTTATKSVVIDSGFSEVILPADEYEAVMNAINPDYDTPTNLLVVKCDSHLPDLTFVVEGGQTLTVTQHQYLLNMDLPDNNCAVAIGQQLPTFMASDFILGNPFLRTYCVAYNRNPDGSVKIDIRDSLTNMPALQTTESVTSRSSSSTSQPTPTTSRPSTSTLWPTTSTASTSTAPLTCCPLGWTYLQETSKCHKATEPGLDWNGALASCKNEGGTLASIHSDVENTAVLNFANTSNAAILMSQESGYAWVYIGLSRQPNLQWTDGSDVTYAEQYVNWTDYSSPQTLPPFCTMSCVNPGYGYFYKNYEWHTIDCEYNYELFGICEQSPLTSSLCTV
jgi:hypothetical protein